MKKSCLFGAGCAFYLMFGVIASAHSATIVNGSMTGPNNAYGLIPTGWSTLFPGDSNSTPDTEGATGPHEQYNVSPDGGTFVAGGYNTSYLNPEGVQQLVNDLIPGTTYRLDFYQSNLGFGIDNLSGSYGAQANWQLYIDGSASGLFSDTMLPETGTLPNNTWFATSITFVATSSSHYLGFAANSVSGGNTFLGIDGVSISTTTVPIPAAIWLFGSGLLALVGISRRKKYI